MNVLGYNEPAIMERNAILFLSQNHDARNDQQAERGDDASSRIARRDWRGLGVNTALH
jgi:hypothetical protein